MLKALLIGGSILASGATASFAAATAPAGQTEVVSTRGHQEMDANKRAWFEREVTKILEGRTAPADSDL